MVTVKEREERGRGVRNHVLVYTKTGRTEELEKALAELLILMRLEGLIPVEKVSQ